MARRGLARPPRLRRRVGHPVTHLCAVAHTRGHLDGCDDDTCPGCRPVLAADGLQVCGWHAKYATHVLSACPGLVAHLRDSLERGPKPTDDQPKGKGEKVPPAPLDVDAMSAADDLHAELVSWALLVMEERDVTGPDWTGSDIRPASKRRTPDGIVYEDARVVGVDDWQATVNVVRFLFVHLDWMLRQDWAGPFVEETTEKVRTIRHRWPTEDRPVYLPVPCPECKCRTLRRYPPAWAGAPITAKCDMGECDHVITEDSFMWAARVLAENGKKGVA